MTRYLGRGHLALTLVWLLLIVPTLLFWRESVLWVALMSIWANVASHAAAYQAHRESREAGCDHCRPAG